LNIIVRQPGCEKKPSPKDNSNSKFRLDDFQIEHTNFYL
jgi:hypothetical protein